MKSFREYLSEEMLPYAQTEKGFVGVDNGPVRDNINIHLASITAKPYATPYHAMEMVRKVLAPFSIFPPSTNFLDGDSGHEIFEINQFGDKMGMTNDGEVVVKIGSPYYVYFEWAMNDTGSFDIFCEIVNNEELDEIMADIEAEMEDGDMASDEMSDAEDSFDSYKAKNQENEMNEETINEGRPSQRHPLEGHPYHKKSDAELIYIAKDAHKAAEAMKGHNTEAENKYADQANDSATVRYWRKKNGMPNWYKKKYGHDDVKKETLDEVSKQLASKASEKAYEAGLKLYDTTTKMRGKALKSKDKKDMDAATAEQGKMSKKWKQSMKFKTYADKKLEEEQRKFETAKAFAEIPAKETKTPKTSAYRAAKKLARKVLANKKK